MTWIPRLLAFSLMVCIIPPVFAADLALERTEFRQAWAAADSGNLARLTPYLGKLAHYPLYPYLRYAYLDSTLPEQPAGAVEAFLRQEGDLPVSAVLRDAWLLALAKRGDWGTFLAHYRNEPTLPLQCAAVSAHLEDPYRHVRARWIATAQTLWLLPSTQPAFCDPAFQYLKAHHRIDNGMVMQRMQQALEARHYALARALLPQLAAVDRPWASTWLDMTKNPATVLAALQVPDEPKFQVLLLGGVRLVARNHPGLARHLWNVLSHRYHFSHDDTEAMAVHLALESAWNDLPDAAQLLRQVRHAHNPEVTEWRLRVALREGHWQKLLRILPKLGEPAARQEWRYWRARALAATGHHGAADAIYRTLAEGTGYYGLLAADRLHIRYAITQQAIRPAAEIMLRLAREPGFVRARELFYAGLYPYANGEWTQAIAPLALPARCQAALLAQQWGWYRQAIRTVAGGGCGRDLAVSYPIAFRGTVTPRAHTLDLSLPWLYGLIRAESVFSPDAISDAGAVGLMQLMPATGRTVAANIGLILDNRDALSHPNVNLTLGSAYLSDLLRRFDGSEPLATAAYNAGPRRVASWLPQMGHLPADVWVDTIPFWETRSYVRRVMRGTVIFDWRLHHTPERLSTRLGAIPTDAALTADSGG